MSNQSSCSDIPIKLEVFYWEQILTSVLLGIIAIAGLIGNSMIVLAVAFSRKLQTTTNALVTSLAVSDLLSSIVLVFYMIGTLGKNGWPLPNAYWICQGTAFLIYATFGTSVYTMASIALNRLVIITKPHMNKKLFRSWKLVLFVVLPWIVPSSGLMVIVLSGIGEFGYDPSDLACAGIDTPCNRFAISLSITIIGFPIPLVVIIVSYVWIYVTLKKHFKRQKLNYINTSTQNKSSGSIPTVSRSVETKLNGPPNSTDKPSGQDFSHRQVTAARRRKHILQQEIKITKNLFIVVCAFLLCFLPYFIPVFIKNPEHILFYTKVITFANSAINFPIYSLRHPDFKVVLRCMVQRSFAEIPQRSKFLKFFLSKNNMIWTLYSAAKQYKYGLGCELGANCIKCSYWQICTISQSNECDSQTFCQISTNHVHDVVIKLKMQERYMHNQANSRIKSRA